MSSIRITISEEFADNLLGVFRNAIEAGCEFDESFMNDYGKFHRSVTRAKRRKRFYEQKKDVKRFLEEHH